jgi:hypothetical protein
MMMMMEGGEERSDERKEVVSPNRSFLGLSYTCIEYTGSFESNSSLHIWVPAFCN